MKVSLILLLLCFTNNFAQESKIIEKFNGTWVWKSNDYFHQIEIEQNDNQIKLKEKIKSKNKPEIERESLYFTDGRGETNKFYEDRFTESITTVRKNKIVINFIFTDPKSSKKIKSGSIELKLKNDRRVVWTQTTLIFELVSSILNQSPNTVRTFEKIN